MAHFSSTLAKASRVWLVCQPDRGRCDMKQVISDIASGVDAIRIEFGKKRLVEKLFCKSLSVIISCVCGHGLKGQVKRGHSEPIPAVASRH